MLAGGVRMSTYTLVAEGVELLRIKGWNPVQMMAVG